MNCRAHRATCRRLLPASLIRKVPAPPSVFQRRMPTTHASGADLQLRLLAYDDLRTRRYQSHKSRTCFGV